MQRQPDVLIAGGGLAGLALAAELASPKYAHLRVLVVEPRTDYVDDRTWSFWDTGSSRFGHLARHRWNAWTVKADGASVDCRSDKPYCTIHSLDFYRATAERIRNSAHVTLLPGVGVVSIEPGRPPSARLSNGLVLQPACIFDSRPADAGATVLHQSFTGIEFTSDRPCFDAGRLTLMDFQASRDGIHFFYVLPYSTTRALVESTWIGARGLGTADEGSAWSYARRRWPGVEFQAGRVERGNLALSTDSPGPRTEGVVRIGSRAGTVRASTGYAFQETVADTGRIARHMLLGGGRPASFAGIPEHRRSPSIRWMDQVFLRALRAGPARAPLLFQSLFTRCPPDKLVEFLAGTSSPLDRWSVISSMPKMPMAMAAMGRA